MYEEIDNDERPFALSMQMQKLCSNNIKTLKKLNKKF